MNSGLKAIRKSSAALSDDSQSIGLRTTLSSYGRFAMTRSMDRIKLREPYMPWAVRRNLVNWPVVSCIAIRSKHKSTYDVDPFADHPGFRCHGMLGRDVSSIGKALHDDGTYFLPRVPEQLQFISIGSVIRSRGLYARPHASKHPQVSKGGHGQPLADVHPSRQSA